MCVLDAPQNYKDEPNCAQWEASMRVPLNNSCLDRGVMHNSCLAAAIAGRGQTDQPIELTAGRNL